MDVDLIAQACLEVGLDDLEPLDQTENTVPDIIGVQEGFSPVQEGSLRGHEQEGVVGQEVYDVGQYLLGQAMEVVWEGSVLPMDTKTPVSRSDRTLLTRELAFGGDLTNTVFTDEEGKDSKVFVRRSPEQMNKCSPEQWKENMSPSPVTSLFYSQRKAAVVNVPKRVPAYKASIKGAPCRKLPDLKEQQRARAAPESKQGAKVDQDSSSPPVQHDSGTTSTTNPFHHLFKDKQPGRVAFAYYVHDCWVSYGEWGSPAWGGLVPGPAELASFLQQCWGWWRNLPTPNRREYWAREREFHQEKVRQTTWPVAEGKTSVIPGDQDNASIKEKSTYSISVEQITLSPGGQEGPCKKEEEESEPRTIWEKCDLSPVDQKFPTRTIAEKRKRSPPLQDSSFKRPCNDRVGLKVLNRPDSEGDTLQVLNRTDSGTSPSRPLDLTKSISPGPVVSESELESSPGLCSRTGMLTKPMSPGHAESCLSPGLCSKTGAFNLRSPSPEDSSEINLSRSTDLTESPKNCFISKSEAEVSLAQSPSPPPNIDKCETDYMKKEVGILPPEHNTGKTEAEAVLGVPLTQSPPINIGKSEAANVKKEADILPSEPTGKTEAEAVLVVPLGQSPPSNIVEPEADNVKKEEDILPLEPAGKTEAGALLAVSFSQSPPVNDVKTEDETVVTVPVSPLDNSHQQNSVDKLPTKRPRGRPRLSGPVVLGRPRLSAPVMRGGLQQNVPVINGGLRQHAPVMRGGLRQHAPVMRGGLGQHAPVVKIQRQMQKDPQAPKRAVTAFFFFNSKYKKSTFAEMRGASVGEVNRELSSRWKKLTDQEREEFLELERKDRARYEGELAKYRESGREAEWRNEMRVKRLELEESVSNIKVEQAVFDNDISEEGQNDVTESDHVYFETDNCDSVEISEEDVNKYAVESNFITVETVIEEE